MKTLLINGSPHANGCTFTALSIVAEELEKNGVETEIVHVGQKDVHGCIACGKCGEQGKCVFDDVVNELAPKFAEADGLVIGSPVYYASANGTLTNLLDRLFYSAKCDKRMKVGAAVTSARRAGTTATLDQLNKYFTISEMPVVSSRYWNMVHGSKAEDVLKDEEGMQIMRVLGRNMAFLIRAIAAERQRNGLPEAEPQRIFTSFVK
ncbi:MAG: flavodoxin family protein [Paludibacteraceae bacterium]|nr:flavodoxin family protein [Paludibacteraceae bacterium]MBP5742225.1 flavodoxin family protein [Paludibacteraceae bacterium]